jgi:hypothetical protein
VDVDVEDDVEEVDNDVVALVVLDNVVAVDADVDGCDCGGSFISHFEFAGLAIVLPAAVYDPAAVIDAVELGALLLVAARPIAVGCGCDGGMNSRGLRMVANRSCSATVSIIKSVSLCQRR